MTVLSSWNRRRADERRAITNVPWSRGDEGGGLTSLAGTTVNQDSALSISAVWACVTLIADTVATMPLGAYVRTAPNTREVLAPEPRWLSEPNEEQTRIEWVFQQLVSLLLNGTSYVYTIRDRLGDVTEAWNVDPRLVYPRRERIGGRYRRVYYVFPQHAVGPNATAPPDDFKDRVRLGPYDMFHTAAFSAPGMLRGIPPLERAREMLGAALAGQEMGARFYGQGMNASGVIEVDEDLTPPQAKDLKEDFSRMNGGLKRMHLPPVLTGGAKFRQISITPEQAQFLQARRFSVVEIARWFRVPPHLVGELERTTSWGKGIEENNIGFARYTLAPWIERLEQAYRRYMLMFQPNAYARFDMSSLLRGDHTARANYYAQGRQWGWLNGDDVHAAEDMPPMPDGLGQSYWVPLNMQELGKEPPAPVGDGTPKIQPPEAPAPDPTPPEGDVDAGT